MRNCEAIIWTNAELLSFGPLGANFSEIPIHTFSLKKMNLEISSAKLRQLYLGLVVKDWKGNNVTQVTLAAMLLYIYDIHNMLM